MNKNNLFSLERDVIVNFYNEKISELNETLSRIQLALNNTQIDPSKNRENRNPNETDDDFRTYNERVQSLQRIYNNLLYLNNNINIIYDQCIYEYDNMNRMGNIYDLNNLNREHYTKIKNFYISQILPQINIANQEIQYGGRRNKLNHADMNMKDIKEMCKANQIKLSRIVNDKRVVYTKKELITKLKRKKLL